MPMKKVCPRCGATFDCMHNDILSCHCATVRLDALQRTYLMENYWLSCNSWGINIC